MDDYGCSDKVDAQHICQERIQNEIYLALGTLGSSILVIHHAWVSYYYYYTLAALHKTSSNLFELEAAANSTNKMGSPKQSTIATSSTGSISSMMKAPLQSEDELIAMAREAQEACMQVDKDNGQ
jgi:hypothetical protein